jgi:hypothetical protein
MHIPPEEFLESMATFLGWFYLIGGAMNLAAAMVAARGRKYASSVVWMTVAVLMGYFGWQSLGGNPPLMPEPVKAAADAILGPVTFTLGAFVGLAVLYLCRRFFVLPAVAWAGLNGSLLFMGLSLTDQQFAAIVTKPDNVPIVGMVYLLGFFTWLSASAAV